MRELNNDEQRCLDVATEEFEKVFLPTFFPDHPDEDAVAFMRHVFVCGFISGKNLADGGALMSELKGNIQ